jgi:hypothetical protein
MTTPTSNSFSVAKLQQCLEFSLVTHQPRAARALADVVGVHDRETTAAAHLLVGSCNASAYMERVYFDALPPAHQSAETVVLNSPSPESLTHSFRR